MDLLIRLLADGLIVVVGAVSLIYLVLKVPRAKRYTIYTHIFMAGLTSYLLAKIIGSLWQPEQYRPFELAGLNPGAAYLNNPGFPSDHMLFGVFLVLAVWYATRNRRLTIILAILTLIMGIARVLAMVHTPIDIIGGTIIAVIGTIWYLRSAGTQKPISPESHS